MAGIPAEKLEEAHGTFATATCRVCHKSYKGDEIKVKVTANIFTISDLNLIVLVVCSIRH